LDIETRIARMIEPSLAAMGFDLVRVKVFTGARPRLQIMAERGPDGGMDVDDCAEVSRMVSALLDVEDPFRAAFDLEVSSPGIDRPLVRPADFERFVGFEAKLTLHSARADGRRRFRGRLLGGDESVVRLRLADGSEQELAFDQIGEAKLVLTDDLIAASLKKDKMAQGA